MKVSYVFPVGSTSRIWLPERECSFRGTTCTRRHHVHWAASERHRKHGLEEVRHLSLRYRGSVLTLVASESKNIMSAAGVPVVPGYHGTNQDASFLQQEAEQIGSSFILPMIFRELITFIDRVSHPHQGRARRRWQRHAYRTCLSGVPGRARVGEARSGEVLRKHRRSRREVHHASAPRGGPGLRRHTRWLCESVGARLFRAKEKSEDH